MTSLGRTGASGSHPREPSVACARSSPSGTECSLATASMKLLGGPDWHAAFVRPLEVLAPRVHAVGFLLVDSRPLDFILINQ